MQTGLVCEFIKGFDEYVSGSESNIDMKRWPWSRPLHFWDRA